MASGPQASLAHHRLHLLIRRNGKEESKIKKEYNVIITKFFYNNKDKILNETTSYLIPIGTHNIYGCGVCYLYNHWRDMDSSLRSHPHSSHPC